jgi:hypothetical protein
VRRERQIIWTERTIYPEGFAQAALLWTDGRPIDRTSIRWTLSRDDEGNHRATFGSLGPT